MCIYKPSLKRKRGLILMHDIFSREPDPLDAMLAPPTLPPDAALRQQVYAQTSRVLQRRRRCRRFVSAAALAASFAAGMLATWLFASRPGPPEPGERGRVSAPRETLGALTQPRSPALTQEWHAFDSTAHRAELYKQAGDAYMTEESDPQSALRCYSSALDNGTPADLAVSTDDNWLLMAIKNARQKEKDHAKTGG
jgi:hypothetical protein